MTTDVKYDTTPHDGTPGQPWEEFKLRLRNVATRSDERGYSLVDNLDGIDEGGPARVETMDSPSELSAADGLPVLDVVMLAARGTCGIDGRTYR